MMKMCVMPSCQVCQQTQAPSARGISRAPRAPVTYLPVLNADVLAPDNVLDVWLPRRSGYALGLQTIEVLKYLLSLANVSQLGLLRCVARSIQLEG